MVQRFFSDMRFAQRLASRPSAVALLILPLFFCVHLQAQVTSVPFESWYGFNTLTGTQTYFLSSAKLADRDNHGDSDVVASIYCLTLMEPPTALSFSRMAAQVSSITRRFIILPHKRLGLLKQQILITMGS